VRIESVQPRGQNPTVLEELRSGYAVIGDVQFLPGYCALLGKDPDAKALAEMPRPELVRFLADVDLLATAVETACRANDPAFRRVNIDILGNADAFVHAHIWPRYEWKPPELVTRPVVVRPRQLAERRHSPRGCRLSVPLSGARTGRKLVSRGHEKVPGEQVRLAVARALMRVQQSQALCIV
jgi:diadenosine tetraphosphate (Ap4A) HIT family hydrolase